MKKNLILIAVFMASMALCAPDLSAKYRKYIPSGDIVSAASCLDSGFSDRTFFLMDPRYDFYRQAVVHGDLAYAFFGGEEIDDGDFFEVLTIADPIEGFNRTMNGFNNVLILYVYRPVGTIYATIFPRFMLHGFQRICDNLEVLVRFLSCSLQARFVDSGIVLLRFVINSTLGIAGFFDVARSWFDLAPQVEDFGQAFASWGLGYGFFLMLPITGPTSFRDGVGQIFDYALDPKSYVYGGQWFDKINEAAIFYEEYQKINESQADPYEFIKDIWFISRNIQIRE